MLRQCLVRPYEHVKHVPNFKPHACRWRPCGRIFNFCKFWRKEKEIEPFDIISENSSPKGFFWSNKKKFVMSLLSADSWYLRIYALNKVAPEISDSVTSIFNKSLTSGVFPEKWKDSNLTPVFKSGQKDVITNYRGISLLSIMSKVLERCVHTRIYNHVVDLLHPN